jgi:NAD(P)-dependent dehydrogenase (short-subunit alcohol dehydrogenase family)
MPTALITGATRGLGHALAFDFARAGYAVYGTGRNDKTLGALEKEANGAKLNIRPVRSDVATEEGVDAIVGRLEADGALVDVVIHNAGTLGERVELATYPLEAWDEVMSTNVRAPFHLTQRLLPLLAPNAAVMFVSSGIVEHPYPRWGAYYVSKVAVEALANLYAAELKDQGIRVFVVDPGRLRTAMRADAFPSEDPKSVPAPEDHTGVYLWLANEAAAASTGSRHEAQAFRS